MLSCDRSSRRAFAGWRGVWIFALAASLLCAGFRETARADDGLEIRELDPQTGNTSPIAADKLRRGNIYSHVEAASNRRVWSHFLGDGRFGIALGPGTMQDARLFNIHLQQRELLDLLRRWDPKLAEDTVREGTEVYLKLSADQHWRLTRTTVAMIYDEATGYRFEQQFGHYIPVGHTYGFAWRPEGTDFVPAP